MRFGNALLILAFVLVGCDKVSSPLNTEPKFELRDFVIDEEMTLDSTSKKFTGTGTLIAKNVSADRNLLVYLETRDKTAGASSEPDIQVVLLRGGVGKVKTWKNDFTTNTVRPDYQWSVLGWLEINKATINVAQAQ